MNGLFCFRLQTGMRGAFGKPCGTVARVRIGQPILSVRTKPNNEASAKEAFRRAKFKFPGRQKVACLPQLTSNIVKLLISLVVDLCV